MSKKKSRSIADRWHLSMRGLSVTIILVIVAALVTALVPKGNSVDPVQSFAQANEIPQKLVDVAKSKHLNLEEARMNTRSFRIENGTEIQSESIRSSRWVLVSCKMYDQQYSSDSSEGYAYRIESPSSKRLVYARSSAFWNGVNRGHGATERNADPSVPDCPQAPAAIAVGANGTILSTVDSMHWTLRHSGTSADLHGIACSSSAPPGTRLSYPPPLWVAVGAHGTILYSRDGTKWSLDPSPTHNDLLAVATNDSQWIAVGANGTVLISPNGLTWTMRPSGTSERLRSVSLSVSPDSSQWVVGGNHVILDSQDNGVSWTNANTMGDPGDIRSVLDTLSEQFGAPSTWLAAGGSTSTAFGGVGLTSGKRLFTDPVLILNSDDGVNWNGNLDLSNEAGLPLAAVYSLAQNSISTSTVTAVGGSGEILSSGNGTAWTTLSSGVTGTLFAVSIGGGSPSQPMIAVGAHGEIVTSVTGYTWQAQPSATHETLYAVSLNLSATPFGS